MLAISIENPIIIFPYLKVSYIYIILFPESEIVFKNYFLPLNSTYDKMAQYNKLNFDQFIHEQSTLWIDFFQKNRNLSYRKDNSRRLSRKEKKKGKIGTILNDRIGRNGTEAFFWMSEKQEFHLVNARGLLSRLLESRKRGKVMARSYLNLGTVPPRVRD